MSDEEKITRMKKKIAKDILKDFPEMEDVEPKVTTETYQSTHTRSRYGREKGDVAVRVLKYSKEIPTFRGITFKKVLSVTVDDETEEIIKVAESRE
ncbi:MAG: hypothetical protein ACFFD2_15575 [Promethearchaeota archaeon]